MTKNFIESFWSNASVSSRLIIIDNASTDGTVEYLSLLKDSSDRALKIVFNKENKGFVGGMNQGMAISDAPYVCLANNDLLFTKGWLEEIVNIFQRYPQIGLLNPNSNNLGERFCEKEISLYNFANDIRNKYRGVFIEMPFCIGFCMVIKRDVINKIGALSEDFYPAFFEDSDYSLRTVKAGYRIGMAKGSYVWHKEHASFDKMDKKKTEGLFKRNREIFVKKWGRILRVACICHHTKQVDQHAQDITEVARQGNYVNIFCKKEKVIDHSGVKCMVYKTMFDLIWKILIKKKRYDVVITDNTFLYNVFKVCGYYVLRNLNIGKIYEFRHRIETAHG